MTFHDASIAVDGRLRGLNLNLLVWGPGDAAGEHYAKCQQVRDRLQQHFLLAEVRFSEELTDVPEWGAELEPHERELWHLAACDVCVVLDTSKGAGEEIAHFVGTTEARKLLILTNEQYRDATSFPASLRRHQNQVFYAEAEYASCDVVKRVLDQVRQVALVKLLSL